MSEEKIEAATPAVAEATAQPPAPAAPVKRPRGRPRKVRPMAEPAASAESATQSVAVAGETNAQSEAPRDEIIVRQDASPPAPPPPSATPVPTVDVAPPTDPAPIPQRDDAIAQNVQDATATDADAASAAGSTPILRWGRRGRGRFRDRRGEHPAPEGWQADGQQATDGVQPQGQQQSGQPPAQRQFHDVPRSNLPPVNLWELDGLPLEELGARIAGFVQQDMLAAVFRRDDAIGEFARNYVRRGGTVTVRGAIEVVADGFGFIRLERNGFAATPDDVYVSPNYIRRFNIRTGDIVAGPIRDAGRERPERGKERSFALARVDSVNGHLATEWQNLVQFEDLVPVHPIRRILLERIAPGPEPTDITMRFVDLFAPVGFGQRGLVIAPPRTGKTSVIRKIAEAVSANYPDAELVVLLIGESPEEITDMERVLGAKVLSSAFDDPPEIQVQVAEMAVEAAKRKVEAGKDVVILMDSITRYARACNAIAPQSGKTAHDGVDLYAMSRPRRFFGAARAIEGGGSLTIIATALAETGCRMDDVVLDELRGGANMTLVLDGGLAARRIFPAIDVRASGTRKEELIVTPPELNLARSLRKMLADSPTPVESMENIIRHMRKSDSNADFIMQKFNQ